MRLPDALSDENSVINRSGRVPIRVLKDVGEPGVVVFEVDDSDPTNTRIKPLYRGSDVQEVEDFLDTQNYGLDPNEWHPG